MSRQRPLRILSNFAKLDQVITPEPRVRFRYERESKGWAGVLRFALKCLRSDLVILNGEPKKLLAACLLGRLLPMARFKLVSVDPLVRMPQSLKGRLLLRFKRLLLRRVHRFVLYFKDWEGYERVYGIGPGRAIYVPYKVNSWENIAAWPPASPDGDYVLCAGRTMRDIKTFVQAMKRAGCPGVLQQQSDHIMAGHGTMLWTGELPPNLELIIDDSNRHESFIDHIARARLVVIPRYRGDIGPAGIATYMVAMALEKCVIISEGPGAGDVLGAQAVVVPAEDAEVLGQTIARLWNDDEARRAIGARARAYALALQGEERLLSDILRVSLESLSRKGV